LIATDVWRFGSLNPHLKGKQSSVLFSLEKRPTPRVRIIDYNPPILTGQSLLLQDIETGRCLQKVILSDVVGYSTIDMEYSAGTVILSCIKSSLPNKTVAADFIIFSYPPLKLVSHLQVCGLKAKRLKPLN